ncbi:hypothetical protein UFOVP529_49 [uncultured Caudovirales phage]|uniref:Uncharacterized protein n=1 Tax=uncultured Caudovirales phage TaxID=2100421 RepID=A0A6J5MZC3_9CAUD|nr:hypothetical protein UFOVP529_49 [uncultured Caudovirales phage]CAB4190751.1 hypothetical protein UFOVP1191_107 [uncultured Caudovirales phage]CAB4194458.1 hypothetical protein UFOVP1252_71 [uncultured Caudovirales phage]
MSYNGWTNHETWLVNLWINEGAAGDLFEIEEQARHFAEMNDEPAATYKMGAWLREQVDGIAIGDQPAGLAADLIGSAMAAVNWDEIAEHFVGDAIRNEAEQTENANA